MPIKPGGVGGGVDIICLTIMDQSVVCAPGISSSTLIGMNIIYQKYQPLFLEEKQALTVLQKLSVYTYTNTQNSVRFIKKIILKIICKIVKKPP